MSLSIVSSSLNQITHINGMPIGEKVREWMERKVKIEVTSTDGRVIRGFITRVDDVWSEDKTDGLITFSCPVTSRSLPVTSLVYIRNIKKITYNDDCQDSLTNYCQDSLVNLCIQIILKNNKDYSNLKTDLQNKIKNEKQKQDDKLLFEINVDYPNRTEIAKLLIAGVSPEAVIKRFNVLKLTEAAIICLDWMKPEGGPASALACYENLRSFNFPLMDPNAFFTLMLGMKLQISGLIPLDRSLVDRYDDDQINKLFNTGTISRAFVKNFKGCKEEIHNLLRKRQI
ncbi:MAG TPA: hypothetical protein VIH61_06530 [Waddliaceae bacterium]